MKNILFVLCITLCSAACVDKAKIQVQNNINNVKIQSVKWGPVYLSSSLLPGESSEKMTVTEYVHALPSKQKVSFKMTANNKTIYLETEEEYMLNVDDDLLIVLDDGTPVKNPN